MTDFLGLRDHKFYKTARDHLTKGVSGGGGTPSSLLTVHEDVLFTWDFQNSCVLTLNVKAARSRDGDNVIHQNLLPLMPVLFTPDKIQCNNGTTMLAISAPTGVVLMELPARYPPYGAFDHNKELVYCRSYTLDERLLTFSDSIEVRQIKFHPGSPNNNHILILTSDNMLRLYTVEGGSAVNLGIYPVGERPHGFFPGTKTTLLAAFGETCVDFDFGQPQLLLPPDNNNITGKLNQPPLLAITAKGNNSSRNNQDDNDDDNKMMIKTVTKTNKPSEHSLLLVWPVYLLRADGQIYYINISAIAAAATTTGGGGAILKGPIPTNHPFVVSNSDEELSSLLCLNSNPETFCIATSKGTIYHAILLPICVGKFADKSTSTFNGSRDLRMVPYHRNQDLSYDIFNTDLSISTSIDDDSRIRSSSSATIELMAFESVELELGLGVDPNDNTNSTSSRIYLHKDESRVGRYYATHNSGVHSIQINCIDNLQEFISNDNNQSIDDSTQIIDDVFVNCSSVEYVMCTKVSNSNDTNSILGFTIYYEPKSVIVFLSDGDLISLQQVVGSIFLPNKQEQAQQQQDVGARSLISSNTKESSPLKKMLKDPFDQFIYKILKSSSSNQPILKLPVDSDHSQKDCYDLLQRASQIFRDHYFVSQTRAREEIEKRAKALAMLKVYQLNELDRMQNDKELLRETAETLAEKYEDIKDKQDQIVKRCEKLLVLVTQRKHELSDAEKEFAHDMDEFKTNLKVYKQSIEKLKSKMAYQKLQMENWKKQEEKKVSKLGQVHTTTIQSNLKNMSQKIATMIKDIHEYKHNLNLK